MPRRPGAARKDSKMLPMPPASAATVSPARRLRGRIRVPGDKSISHRYALLAAAGRRAVAPVELRAGRRLPLDAFLPAGAGDGNPSPGRRHHYTGTRFGRLAFTRRPARRRQLRDGHADAHGVAGRPPFHRHARRRRVSVRPANAAGHRAADPDGRQNRLGRRPRADHGARRTAARHCLRAGDSERAGEERHPARRPSSERDDVGHGAGADARSHRARLRRVRDLA